MIIITHDMGVIAEITDRVAVLYRGKLVEEGPTAKILGDPDHPYTKSLISAVPRSDVKLRRFPMVTYIEDVLAPVKKEFDIATPCLGQERDFGTHKPTPIPQIRDLHMRFPIPNPLPKKN